MVSQFVASLERPVSHVWLENYRSENVTDGLDMVIHSFFNFELSEALYPVLQAFEVALPNRSHVARTMSMARCDTMFDSVNIWGVEGPA